MTSVITASIIRLKEGDTLGGNGAVGRLWHINKDGTLKRNKSRSFSISCVRPVMSHGHEHPVGICLLSTRSGIVPPLRCSPSFPRVEAREALRVLTDSQLSTLSVWNAGRWLYLSTRTKKKKKRQNHQNLQTEIKTEIETVQAKSMCFHKAETSSRSSRPSGRRGKAEPPTCLIGGWWSELGVL